MKIALSSFRQNTLFLVLSRQTLWIYNQQKLVQHQETEEPLTLDQIVSACRQWEGMDWVLFLDYPWVISQFEAVLPLSAHDVVRYSKNRFNFHVTDSQLSGDTGAAFLDHPGSVKKGLFYSLLAPQSMLLIQTLKTQCKRKVSPVPLMYACLPGVSRRSASDLIFQSAGQTVFIKKQDSTLLKWIPLSSTHPSAGKNLILDHDALQSPSMEILHLSPHEEDSHAENTLSVLEAIRDWKGLSRNPHRGFWWESQESSRKQHWKKVGFAGILVLLIGWVGSYFQTLSHLDALSEELKQAQKQIEASQNEIARLNDFTRRQNHFLKTNTLYQHLKSSSIIAKNVLEQVIAPIQGVWVKSLKYEEEGLELSLLTLDPRLVSQVLAYLHQAPIIHSVRLRYQQHLTFSSQEVIEFALSIQLKNQNEDPPVLGQAN